MRQFTKSMTSYTWAMSLFGFQQMLNVFNPTKATESFNNVTKATEDQFGDALKATFRAGDNLQKGLVDVTFGVLTLGVLDGSSAAGATSEMARQTGEALRQGGRVVSQAVDVVGQTVQSATQAAVGVAQQAAGSAAPSQPPSPPTSAAEGRQQQTWGPMPARGSAV